MKGCLSEHLKSRWRVQAQQIVGLQFFRFAFSPKEAFFNQQKRIRSLAVKFPGRIQGTSSIRERPCEGKQGKLLELPLERSLQLQISFLISIPAAFVQVPWSGVAKNLQKRCPTPKPHLCGLVSASLGSFGSFSPGFQNGVKWKLSCRKASAFSCAILCS